MWSTEHTEQTDVAPAAIWAALRALHEGELKAPGGDRFEIHGPFAVGTELSVTPAGQDTFRSTIVELEPERRYADETAFGDVTLRFAHTVVPLGSGTRITHELQISGPGADSVGPELGPQISDDFPAAMAGLISAARSLSSGRAEQ
jgi:hypothetical protein